MPTIPDKIFGFIINSNPEARLSISAYNLLLKIFHKVQSYVFFVSKIPQSTNVTELITQLSSKLIEKGWQIESPDAYHKNFIETHIQLLPEEVKNNQLTEIVYRKKKKSFFDPYWDQILGISFHQSENYLYLRLVIYFDSMMKGDEKIYLNLMETTSILSSLVINFPGLNQAIKSGIQIDNPIKQIDPTLSPFQSLFGLSLGLLIVIGIIYLFFFRLLA